MALVHWLAISRVPGIGGVTARRLVERCGSVEAVFSAEDDDLLAVPRVTAEMVQRLRSFSLEELEGELDTLAEQGTTLVCWDDDDYPHNLLSLNDAPPLLFWRGSVMAEDERAVAIVGTREPTPQGVRVAEALAKGLAERRVTVVSGLALGIDGEAHRGALAADGGRTLAVLGSGLRAIHPREHAGLARQVMERGAVLSELYPDTPVSGPNLMARDRLISGLSRAVIVVEAAEKSGSMDTAAKARRQGRLLLAVPGSPGTDLLVAQGAERVDPDGAGLDALAARIIAGDAPQPGERQLSLF
jgi:DNA processing protein